MGARSCEGCGARMSPFIPRKRRVSDDKLVCAGCEGKSEPFQETHAASRFIGEVTDGNVVDMVHAMIRSNGGRDVTIERESASGHMVVATSNDMSAEWATDLGERLSSIPGVRSMTFEATRRTASDRKVASAIWWTVSG